MDELDALLSELLSDSLKQNHAVVTPIILSTGTCLPYVIEAYSIYL